jgi:putative transposase
MTKTTLTHSCPITPRMEEAWQAVDACFGRFCLTAGIEALQSMMAADVEGLCGGRHARNAERRGHRWGRTRGKIGYHGGKVDVVRPRVRARAGDELMLPSWAAATSEDWLGRTAMNLMLIGVATRKIGRAVRLPEGHLRRVDGDGTSKSAASRRFVALSQERMEAWLSSDLSKFDLLVIQIDGLHVAEDIVLVGAIGIDANGEKHVLGLVDGATENAAAVQALLNNLLERGLDPMVLRLFILDGAKALSKAVKATFGRATPIQRCQVHKARNIAERCPKKHVASVRSALRKAWEMDDASAAERLIRDLAKRLAREAPGIRESLLEGLDEILTVNRLRLPPELRRSLACTNAIENMQGTIRRVTRNVKRWRDASMALRWAAAGMMEAKAGFRRLKAHRQLAALRRALAEHQATHTAQLKVPAKLAETTKSIPTSAHHP